MLNRLFKSLIFKRQSAASFLEFAVLMTVFATFIALIAVKFLAEDPFDQRDQIARARIAAALREPPTGLAFGSPALSAGSISGGSVNDVLAKISDAEIQRIRTEWQKWLDNLDYTIRSTPGQEDVQDSYIYNGMLFSGTEGVPLVTVCNHVETCPTAPSDEVVSYLNNLASAERPGKISVYAALTRALQGTNKFKIEAGTGVGLTDEDLPPKEQSAYTPLPLPSEVCGDGNVTLSEGCDDGNAVGGDGCSATCNIEIPPAAVCGDGTRDPGEDCDDGNTVSGDGCDSSCLVEVPPTSVCGNSLVEGDEACDDGNAMAGDSCSPACQLEVCGNGVQDPGEACDDGNAIAGDICSPTCKITGCGDDSVIAPEECDDGNLVDGDGCSATCTTEEPTPEPTATATETVTPTVTATATETQTSTATATPTETATATASATETPTMTPTETATTTPTETATTTPTGTATTSPTATDEPTETPEPTATPAPNPDIACCEACGSATTSLGKSKQNQFAKDCRAQGCCGNAYCVVNGAGQYQRCAS